MSARAVALAALLGALAAAPTAQAANFAVSTGADAGIGSLRQAVADANAMPGADTISFDASVQLVTITAAPIAVTAGPLAIADPQRDVVVRRTAGTDPLIEVQPATTGVSIDGLSFAGASRPLALGAGANGGVQAPSGLRVVARSGGGTLVTGSTLGAGAVELLRGDPGSATGALSTERFNVSGGEFSRVLSSTIAPGGVLAATFTSATGTSELASARAVGGDTTPPFLLGAGAVSQAEVRIQPSEPLAPASVQPADFVLVMGGVERPLTAATMDPDGSKVTLASSAPWLAGEAGFVRLAAPGAVADAAGNASTSVEPVRVTAAPGDVVEPFASSLSLRPATICLTRGPRCPRAGTLVTFIASEPGRAAFVVVRVNRRVGARSYDVKAGRNRIRFEGRIRGKKLRKGSYRLVVYLDDAVGNQTVNPPLQRFSVRRTLARSAR